MKLFTFDGADSVCHRDVHRVLSYNFLRLPALAQGGIGEFGISIGAATSHNASLSILPIIVGCGFLE